jgi:hypothetical protein
MDQHMTWIDKDVARAEKSKAHGRPCDSPTSGLFDRSQAAFIAVEASNAGTSSPPAGLKYSAFSWPISIASNQSAENSGVTTASLLTPWAIVTAPSRLNKPSRHQPAETPVLWTHRGSHESPHGRHKYSQNYTSNV